MIADKSPPLFKTILVLANSRKLSGRCIAGVELDEDWRPLGWVRPVSGREHGEVSEYERQYSDGSHPDVLDVAQVPLVKHVPETYQSEKESLLKSLEEVKAGLENTSDNPKLPKKELQKLNDDLLEKLRKNESALRASLAQQKKDLNL